MYTSKHLVHLRSEQTLAQKLAVQPCVETTW